MRRSETENMCVPAIELNALTKRFRKADEPAVNAVNLSVSQGEVLAIVGGSGSGKTTTLKMINRLIEPSSGSVRVMGEDVTDVDPVVLKRSIGYAFQGVGLFPHMTVSRRWRHASVAGLGKEAVAERVSDLLAMVDLPIDEYKDRMPSTFGGSDSVLGLHEPSHRSASHSNG